MIYKESSLEPISERRNSAQSDLPELPPLSPVGALFPDLPVPSHHRASAPQVSDSELRGYPSPHPPRTVSATSSVCSSPNVTPASPPLRRPSTPPISISSANPISPIVPIPPVIALQNADNLPTPLSTPQLPSSSPNLNSPSPNGKSRPSTLFSLFSRKKSHDFSSSFNFSSQSPADITSLALKKLLEYLRDMYDLDETNSQENLVRLRRREWDVEKDVENGDAGQVIDEPKTTEEEEEEKRKKKLKKQENIQRRHKIVAEILSTEQTYISELDKLVQIYLNPLESAPSPSLLTSDEIRFVFSNIRSILQFHQDYFYKGLQKVTDLAEQSIGKVFVEHGAFFKMYSVYINNFDKANSELEKWVAKRKKLKAFMQKCATHPLHTQFTIQSYLILPIQRIPRYRLLLQDLLDHTKESHPDYGNLVRALEEVEKRAKEINESKRNHDLAHKIVQIQSRIKGTFKAPLVQPHRRLIREGTLKVAKFVKLVPRGLDKVLKEQKIDDEFWFCLFNDILIQCKPDGEKLELWRTLRLNTRLEPASLIIPSELANSHFPIASTPSVSTPQISSNQLVQNYLGSSIPTPGTPGSMVSCSGSINGSGTIGLDGKVWMRLVDAHVILYLSGDLDEVGFALF
ncbi:Dbl homology domain-containing protein [Paraphysoderma sedebokerense]|nr:Dbl homology domain-containing protein [Paraphysoderma sedebokerense]KAI9138196.1 Dbl homology domain-containing protein [Paraphysoderma sedebokerense]